MPEGGCHCGRIRYAVEGAPQYSALCHCSDCRKSAGAPMVGWALFAREAVRITGDPVAYRSSESGLRQFCATCGTGLFYSNETVFPGMIDVQTATLDDPDTIPPAVHIQVADSPRRLAAAHDLPRFERYPA